MIRFTTLCLAILLLVGAFGTAHAQSQAGAASTTIAAGARSDGMGRAFAAVADDANMIWWNPGGMAFVRGHEASFMYSQLVPDLVDDVNFSYLAYVQHVEGWGGLGAAVGYLSYGKTVATDDAGNDRGEFGSKEIVPTIAYGTELADNVGFGVALKLIRVDLAPADVTLDGRAGAGTTFAADIGTLWKIPAWKASFGAVFQNLGPDIAYIDEEQSDPLSRTLKVGLAYTPFENEVHRVLVAADANRFILPDEIYGVSIWNAGVEYEFNRLLALRAGYVSDPGGGITDMTYGLGLTYKTFRFDYASFPQFELLDRVNRFSATYHF